MLSAIARGLNGAGLQDEARVIWYSTLSVLGSIKDPMSRGLGLMNTVQDMLASGEYELALLAATRIPYN